jgi:CheY-like chemotaxis protein
MSAGPGAGKTILLIEDDFVTRQSLALLLCQRGYTVAQTSSGEEALAYLRSHPLPALVLLDLGLPGMSGWEFLECLRRDLSLGSIPILILTGTPRSNQEPDSASQLPFLQKPVEDEQLAAIVASLATERPEVLVVEDEEAVSRMLAVALRLYGFEARLAGCGREAIELYRQHHEQIALVLLDVQMPDLDGPQTLVQLRQINPHLRCCFMSGNTGRYSAEELLALGAAHVLSKPFSSLSEVARLLRQLARQC